MNNIISFYPNLLDSKSQLTINIEDFLFNIARGEYKTEVETYRNRKTKDANDKKKLASATISGTFKHRKADSLIKHSGLIAMDFDNITAEEIKPVLKDKYTYAAFTSVSKNGYCVIVKINGNRHLDSWKGLANHYRNSYNLHVDPSGKDVSRTRFVSYDPDMKMNPESEKFNPPRQTTKKKKHNTPIIASENDFDHCINQVIYSGKDITADYYEWIKIGFVLYGHYGDAGLDKFHAISSFHPKYDAKKTESKWNNITKTYSPGKVNDASLFYICREHGIEYQSPRTKEITQTSNIVKSSGGSIGEIQKELKKKGIENLSESELEITKFDDIQIDKQDTIQSARLYLDINLNLWKCNIRQKYFNDKEPITDGFVSSVWEDMNIAGIKVNKDTVNHMIRSDKTKVVDPLRDWFEEHQTKGTDAIEELIDCIPYKYPEIAKKLWRTFFMGVMETLFSTPKPYCLVLTGSLGNTGKTQFITRLLPNELKEWFGEAATVNSEKDASLLASQKLLFFNDEFKGNMVKDGATFKSLLSSDNVSQRLAFDKYHSDLKRICSFVGTSNEDELIFDKSTVNRRIFPVEVIGRIDWERSNKVDRTKLWGQIYDCYLNGCYSVDLTPEELDELGDLSKNYEATSWVESFIDTYVEHSEIPMPFADIHNQLKDYFKKMPTSKEVGTALKARGYKAAKVPNQESGKRILHYYCRIINPNLPRL